MIDCVLDTDVVIAALDRADAHHEGAEQLLGRLVDDQILLFMSTINYAEVLVRPAERKDTLRTAVAAIEAMGIVLVPPTAVMARDAAGLRGLGISLADGFALATARAHDASIASFDKRVRRSVESIGLQLAE